MQCERLGMNEGGGGMGKQRVLLQLLFVRLKMTPGTCSGYVASLLCCSSRDVCMARIMMVMYVASSDQERGRGMNSTALHATSGARLL
jgi:hypothetical protein